MNEIPSAPLDSAAFSRVWQRVMPQDRPDCPFTLASADASLPAPVQPKRLCLGTDSLDQLPRLDALLTACVDSARICRALERKFKNTPAFLSAAKLRQARRLGCARFLISGKHLTPPPTPAPTAATLPLALRDRFHSERASALALLDAAASAADPCLAELYRELAGECAALSGRIRDWLERPPQRPSGEGR